MKHGYPSFSNGIILKPCPFCDKSMIPKIEKRMGEIYCYWHCWLCNADYQTSEEDKKRMINWWNRRADK